MDPLQKSSADFRNISSGNKDAPSTKKYFHHLERKWNVSGKQLVLILIVFAITGTTTAYLTRMITRWFQLDISSIWYWVAKVAVLVFGYQILILLIAIPFGQFRFFWNYEKKILRWFGILPRDKGAADDK
ncbi:MAG TPA: DUF6787 family protein [Flavitalea sp.]|nr:DUF6787 family protein [Flavitalea sp.]